MTESVRQNLLSPKLPVPGQSRINWSRLYGSARSLAIANMAMQTQKLIVVVTADMISAVNLINELNIYIKENSLVKIITFPDWETLPYDLFSPYQDIISERLQTLFDLPNIKQGIVVVPITTVMHRLLPSDYLFSNSLVLDVGQFIKLDSFRKQLNQQGYRFVDQVTEHGEASKRGSLLDIFPMGAINPFRIDLFDDEIDSIRTFDIETQRSIDKVESIRILPAREIALVDSGIARFRANWRERFEGNPGKCSVYNDVSQSLAPAGIEYYLPLFYEETSILFDYIADDSILVLDDGVKAAAETFWEDIEARYEQERYDLEKPILPPRDIFLNTNDLYSAFKLYPQVHIENLSSESNSNIFEFDSELPTNLSIDARAEEPFILVRRFLGEFDGRVLIAAETQGRRETIMELFKHIGTPDKVESWDSFLYGNVEFGIAIMPIENGLIMRNPNLAIITEAQLFSERVVQRRLRKRKQQDAEAVVRNLTELNLGAPIVHENHGVGRYCGLISIDTGGIPSEFIHLEYAEGDKLYVPVAALELISRYTGVNPEQAPLHKLGSPQWQKARRKAVEKVYDVAAELLELHARRASRKGQSYEFDQDAYFAFVQKFPFEETPGQYDAIQSMIED